MPEFVADADSSDSDMDSVHRGFACDSCDCAPIIGERHHCEACADYDLCNACFVRLRDAGELESSAFEVHDTNPEWGITMVACTKHPRPSESGDWTSN